MYLNPKIYHMASKINQNGGVSALCFKKLKPINLSVASWTNRRTAVTCPKCLRILAGMAYETRGIQEEVNDVCQSSQNVERN